MRNQPINHVHEIQLLHSQHAHWTSAW